VGQNLGPHQQCKSHFSGLTLVEGPANVHTVGLESGTGEGALPLGLAALIPWQWTGGSSGMLGAGKRHQQCKCFHCVPHVTSCR
jgi:hypothetical protein